MCEFGKQLRDKEFLLKKECVHINNGSWGAVPKTVQEERLRLMSELEDSPDHWFRRTIRGKIDDNLNAAASFLGANPQNMVFVANATTGCNSVMKSFPLQPGDLIMINSYTYYAIQNAAKAAAKAKGADVIMLDIPLDIPSVEDLLQRYTNFITQHKNIKLLVLDYISSPTGIKYPVQEIVSICKQHDIKVLLDGAHSPGQINLNLEDLGEIGVDFYTGNFHKWVLTPRGCAVLWCHPRHHDILRPLVTSHSYNSDNIQDDFFTQGTMDHTPYLCVNKAIQFYKQLGGIEEIQKYCSNLLDQATQMLCDAWGTESFPIPAEMKAPFLRMVRLPDIKGYSNTPQIQGAFSDVDPKMMDDFYNHHQVATTLLIVHGKTWVRLSCFVYNTMEDYNKLRDTVLLLSKS